MLGDVRGLFGVGSEVSEDSLSTLLLKSSAFPCLKSGADMMMGFSEELSTPCRIYIDVLFLPN